MGPIWVFRNFQTHVLANYQYDLADISVVTDCFWWNFQNFVCLTISASEFSGLSALFSGQVTRPDRAGRSCFFQVNFDEGCSIDLFWQQEDDFFPRADIGQAGGPCGPDVLARHALQRCRGTKQRFYDCPNRIRYLCFLPFFDES